MVHDEVFFTITEVADQVGVVSATIRNWEKHGLFVAKRSQNGYRQYTLSDIDRLRDIKRYSKDESMGINAIRKFYGDEEHGGHPAQMNGDAQVSKKLIGQKWKNYRVQRGYLLDDVADKVGISVSYLSKIENGQANVSYDILQRVATFYGESILYYVNDTDEETHLVRKGEGEAFSIGIDGVNVESVVAFKKHTLSSMIYTAEPGCGRFEPVSHNGEEFVHVVSGRISMTINGQEYIMKPGDSMSFSSLTTHSWHNCGKSAARLLWIYTPLVKE
jgi:DNA-binding transcriptional MerR regulator/quercetin dioxygenase-like cupin family protein